MGNTFNIKQLLEKLSLKELAAKLSPYLNLTNTGGSGDMTKAVYDTDDDGIVDEAATATDALKIANNLNDVADQQTALNNLTDVTSATDEYVLTKDTATGDAIFKASAAGGYTDEQAQDAVGGILVDGTTVNFTYNDGIPSITAEVQGLDSTNISDFTEAAQDAVGAMIADTATIDLTYTDATPALTADVKASSITEAMQTLADNTTNDVSTTKHGYVPKAPNDTTKFLRGDATWAVPAGGGGYTIINKNSDETISSDNTLSDDSTLQFATTANRKYSIIIYMMYTAGNTTADFKLALAHTGTTTSTRYDIQGQAESGGNVTNYTETANTSMGTTFSLTGAQIAGYVRITCYLDVGASGGTFSLQWAQNTSTAVNTTVFAGSYLWYKDIT